MKNTELSDVSKSLKYGDLIGVIPPIQAKKEKIMENHKIIKKDESSPEERKAIAAEGPLNEAIVEPAVVDLLSGEIEYGGAQS